MAKEIMLIGATSDVAQAMAQLIDDPTTKIWLVSRNVKRLEPLKTHLEILRWLSRNPRKGRKRNSRNTKNN